MPPPPRLLPTSKRHLKEKTLIRICNIRFHYSIPEKIFYLLLPHPRPTLNPLSSFLFSCHFIESILQFSSQVWSFQHYWCSIIKEEEDEGGIVYLKVFWFCWCFCLLFLFQDRIFVYNFGAYPGTLSVDQLSQGFLIHRDHHAVDTRCYLLRVISRVGKSNRTNGLIK